jgi:hypothetical protein
MENQNLILPETTTIETTNPGLSDFETYVSTRQPNYNIDVPKQYLNSGRALENPANNISTPGLFDRINNTVNNTTNTSEFSYKASDVSKRYPKNFLGINNEELYAQNQSTTEKAYNGVVKMAGIATTTFINGTAGLVYGITKAAEDGKISSFYDNDLTNWLNDVNNGMEDSYAHYKTERELKGDWWEPSNLLTANFLFDNIVKNLGFSLGAAAAGFAWGGVFNAIGLTGKLIGTGAEMATQADIAISEAALLPEVERLSAINSKLNNLWAGAKSNIGKGLMKTDQAIVATFGTFGEAGMEALNNSQEFRKNLMNEYKQTHGYNAEGADLDKINKDAESVGNWSFGLNTALLTATNYIQLPKIYASSFKAEKGILNNIALQGERYASTLPEKGFGKLLYKSKNIAGLFVNTAEGFEEGAQFAIQTGTQNYFNKKYNNQEASALDDGLLYGVKEALTTGEGTLNIFTGAFSGALQSSGFVGIKNGLPTIGRTGKIGERGLTGYGGTQAVERKEAIDALNKSMIKDKMKDAYSNIKAAEIIQQEREAAIRQGDILESKDLEFDYAHNFITTRLKYNAKTAIDNEITDLKQQALTDAGFLQLQQQGTATNLDTKESFTNRLTNLQKHADSVAKMYEATKIKYKGLVDKETGKRLYTDDVIDQLVYAGSKVLDYDNRIPQLDAPLSAVGINTLDILGSIITDGVPKEEAVAKAVADIKALDTTNEDELITNLKDLIEVSLRRKNFIEEYKEIKNTPQNFKKEESVETDEKGNIIPKKTINVKTKKGDRNIEIGTEYFLGKRVFEDSKGKEVFRTPKIIILGENEDGTIKIKDAKGDVRDISKDELLDYSLAKVSSTLNNKTAKYYLEHMNSVFAFYGKKVTNEKGERVPVKGRLEYEQTDKGEKDKLFFVYKDEKGKIVRKEIDGSMVVPKKGYKHAILKHVGELTPAQQQAEVEFGKTTSDSVQKKLQRRADTLIEMYEEVLDKKENTEKLISEKTAKLESLRKQITDTTEQIETNKNPQDKRFKEFTLKETIFDAISQLKALSKMEQDLQQELEELYSVDDELKLNVEYLEDLIENIEELPDSTKEFINELNDELIDLHIMVEETGKQINTVSSLLDDTRDAIKSAIKYLSSLIKNFESRYFNVPSPEGQEWVDFLKANPNFLKTKPNYKAELSALEEIIATTEDFKITPNERRLEDLEEHLDILQGALKDYEKQIKVRENVLEKLEEILNKYKEQQKQEQELARNEKLIQEWVGTMDNSIQPVAADNDKEKVYEGPSKKSDRDVVQGTVPVNNDRPHNLRANRFGNRFNAFSEKKQKAIKGRIVTLKTEELQGVKGLSELITAGEASPSDVIAMVMVIENNDGTYSLVDELGNPFNDEQKQNPLEHAVFQVFPSDKLEQRYMKDGKRVMETMFRESTDKDLKESLSKQYREWRTSVMAKDDLSPPLGINASFGLPEYVTTLVEKVVNGKTMQVEEINYNATTPVEKTGLVDKESLGNDKLITISTSNGVSEGSVTFKTDAGRVFLTVPGGLIKLNNRKLNTKEATAVYEAILRLSQIAFEKGTIKDDVQAQQIVRWLKTVVYWGIAKNPQTGQRKQAGYNNIWFEDVVNEKGEKSSKLFISGMGANLSFTPSEISSRRSELVSMIGALYHNVNKTLTDERSWGNPYTEIVGFDKNGETVTREWKNYQTYLLSSEGRTEGEIPLTTIVRPKTSENDVVKKAVYFTYMDNADTFNFEITKPAEVVKKEAQPVAPQAPVVTPPVQTKEGEVEVNKTSPFSAFKADGKTVHKYKTSAGVVNVIINEDGTPDFAFTDKEGISDDETLDTIDTLVEKTKKEPGELIDMLMTEIYSVYMTGKMASEIPTDNAATAAPVQEEPEVVTPSAPVSDIEAKKADIKKRKKEALLKLQSLELGDTFAPKGTVSEKLNEIAKFFITNFGWKFEGNRENVAYVSKENNRVEFDIDGLEVNLEQGQTFRLMGGAAYPTFTPQEVIEAKYNAELNALKEVKPAKEIKPEQPSNDPFSQAPKTNGVDEIDDTQFRIAYKEATTYPTENFNKLEEWLKAKLPNIPVYRVKNIIQATNGRQAWGMLHKGAIYLYENAEIGTAYHEVFEAVWAMMTTPAERNAIAKDFRRREGSYVDRFTGETVVYKDATDDQMREELAEEFREYVLYDKNPKEAPAPKTPSFLRKIFDWIINGIKTFFVGKDAAKNTQELFDRIGDGYYRKYIPYEQKLSFAEVGYIDINSVTPDASSRYSLAKTIENISATEIHQLMQQMTSSTIVRMIGNNDDLFNVTKMNRAEMYEILKNEILNKRIKPMADQIVIDARDEQRELTEQENFAFNNLRTLYNNIANQWPLIQRKHQEYLLSYGIAFDENDDVDYNNYEKSKDEGWGDARKIDAFKKLNATIKLLLSSIAETRIVDGKIRPKFNNIGGVNLLPLGSVYVDLLNQLHDAIDQPDMIRKFREAARQNPNYNALFTRIFKIDPASDQAINYNILNKSDLRIVEGFWKTFKKQSPTVSALFILPNGEVVVGDSNTSGLVREYRRQFLNNFITKARTNSTPYIAKHTTKGFVPTNRLLSLQETQDLGVLVKFLDNIGIEFSENKLANRKDLQKDFREATNGLIRSLKERVTEEGIERINVNTLNASNRLLELGLIKAKLETSEAETTYFNINGERSQTFLGPNLLSSFYDVISQVDTISELEGTNFGYLLTDSYSTIGSVLLDRIFDEKGNKRKGVFAEILKPYLVDGTIDEESGKNTESSKLNKRQRYIQELNMNINGVYMNLVPGDANMQTAIKLHEKDSPFVTEDMLLNKTYMEIFKNQLLSEIVMSRESDRPLSKGRNGKDLRFYKEILGESLHKKVVRVAQETDKSAEAIYDQFETEIKNSINEFINNKSNKSIDKLMSFNIISKSDDGKYSVEDIALFKNEETYTLENIKNQMKIQQMNFMIANTELHKLLYSDPYQYSDELKRIKNFASPRQILSYGNSGANSRYNVLYNNEGEDKLFNTNFNRDTINGATISDVLSDNEELEYTPFEETDGGGYITDKGKRYIKIKNGEWTDENEQQYTYDMAYMKKVLGVKLSPVELERWKNGNPNNQSNYTPEKPIVAGNKNMGRSYNDVVLDKFALFPISFRMIHELNPTANMLKLYEKMIKDDVDYVVYQTGRKVGAENVYQLYNKDGNFNESPLISEEEKKNPLGKQTVLTLPLSIFAIQTEVPTKENNEVTQGSQPTKLATMDYMEAGVPIDFMSEEPDFEKRFDEWAKLLDKSSYNNGDNLYNELKNNQALLEARIENGLEKLFKKLGIKKTGVDSYTLDKPELTFELLKEELLKREVNDNIVAALNGYEDGKFVLEAIPSYQQIRNILYSVAHKAVVSPKLKGGQKVQVSSALLESVRGKAKEVTDEKGNTKLVYSSDILRFYTNKDGKRTCQIMISRWFNSPLSDEELMNYFNNTEEGKKQLSALAGVAFRIPTQKQNSIEAFEIAKFLPQGFGDSVIVPSALVKKVGSDFDIDKLFIYLKSLYTAKDGKLKVVPYFGIGKEAKSKIEELYNSGELDEYIKSVKNALPEGEVEDRLFKSIFPEEYAASKQDVIEKFYRESLDNAYISSFEKLVSHPLNFVNLVKPNSAKQMQDLTSEIEQLVGIEKPNYSDASLMLDREFMSELRNDFVRGKYNIGIAATSQTGNAQSQRGLLTIDTSKLDLASEKDRRFLQDGSIRFTNFNRVKGMATLSKIQDANSLPEDRNYISDVIGQVIDGFVDVNKDPWVMRLGITTNTAGTWLFLIRLGVPLRDVGFFMNQPIIRDFLQTLENNGYSYLFSSNVIDAVKETYETNIDNVEFSTIPSEKELTSMMGGKELGPLENAKQLFILDEFLKYSKMAEHLLTFTQATNFDTATFNDPFLIFKKTMQIARARKTIFSNVDEFLDASFIGKLKEGIDEFRDGIAEILLSDRKNNPNGESIRSVLETVLMPYVNKSDAEFISTSKKAVLTLFDWAVQTDRKINTELSRVLLYKEGGESVASKVMKLKKEAENPKHKLHNNYVLKSVQAEVTEKEGEPDNLYISAIGSKVYDQNQIIYGLREIKKFLPENQKDLYGGIIRLAVLQSGLTNSRIAYTSLLPFEDFVEVYNQTLSKIDVMPNLSDFLDTNSFERSNWSDTDIVPSHKERVIKTKKGTWFKPETTLVNKKLRDAMFMGEIPRTVNISNYSQEAQHDVITFIWSDMSLTKNQKRDMAKRGDYSFLNKGLFKKVYAKNKEGVLAPIVYETTSKNKKTGNTTVYKNYVYKMINAWGDSIYAKEFYGKEHPLVPSSTTSFPSVINNGYEKVEKNKEKEFIKGEKVITKGEVEDSKIVEILGTSAYVEGDEFIFSSEEESLPLQTEEEKKDDTCNPF